MAEQQWFRDLTEDVHYRVTVFRHTNGRTMEEWYCSNGDHWYLEVGVTRKTFLVNNILTPCEPIPGMLSKTFEH